MVFQLVGIPLAFQHLLPRAIVIVNIYGYSVCLPSVPRFLRCCIIRGQSTRAPTKGGCRYGYCWKGPPCPHIGKS